MLACCCKPSSSTSQSFSLPHLLRAGRPSHGRVCRGCPETRPVSEGDQTGFVSAVTCGRSINSWALPFRGRAEYAPEHGLWFGFSESSSYREPSRLCAWDLTSAAAGAGAEEPPMARHTWEAAPWDSQVAHLGGGRFCLAWFDQVMPRPPRGCCKFCYDGDPREFAVLTGLEVRREDEDGGGLRLVEHKTRRYSLGDDTCSSFSC